MSQPTRPKKGRETPRQNPLPAVLSALVVVAVFVVLGFMLLNNRPGQEPQTAGQVTEPFAAETPEPGAPVPTVAGEPGAVPTVAAPPAAAPPGAYSAPPPMTIDPQKSYMATITTPRGDIVIKLRPDLAPQTVNSFIFLSKEGFYNGTTWHRVLPNFMAQGGDPTGTGTGGPGYTVPDEFTKQVSFDRPGIMAMANTGQPNSGGSQFFITTAPATYLDGSYTIFGEVAAGQDIVNGIPLRDPEQNPTTPGEQIVKISIAEQ